MARATRKTTRKLALGAEEPLLPNMPGPGSDSTLPTTETVDNESPERRDFQGRARADLSRLSQTLEPLSINNAHVQEPFVAPSSTVGEEAYVLGADVALVKEAIAAMTRLQGLGFERYQIPVPKCIILGEQSTGKSSVIEAISGIKTPRADGTCTRCPLYIQLEPAKDPQAPWQARVRLRTSFKYDGQTSVTSGRKFPGWSQIPATETDFATTSSPEELETLISRAQMATLSGGNADPTLFRHGPLDRLQDIHQLAQFSPNCVCIYVSQPDLPSLSFYDLPGIIGQSEDISTQFLVKFVKDLVTDYIRDPESLILVTCSLDNDIHNSTAAGIAREESATARCVGVLTKPDCLPRGSREEKLLGLLRRERFQLGHGYFIVKNLSQDKIDLGLTNHHARADERSYFQTALPWAHPHFQEYSDRFGTGNLQAYLSKKLAAQALGAIPLIRNKVGYRLQAVKAELSKLPEPPSHNAIFITQEILRNFTREIELEVVGEPLYNTWRNLWEDLQTRFFEGLVAMKPRLLTSGQRDQTLTQSSSAGKSRDESIVIDSEGDSEDEEMESPPPQTPSKKRKLESKSAQGTPIKGQSGTVRGSKTDNEFHIYGKVLNLDDVAGRLKNSSKSRIPGELNPKVLDSLIIESLQHWQKPMERFFEDLEFQMKGLLRSAFERHFAGWKDAEIYRASWSVLEQLLKCHFDEQSNITAPSALNDELKGPYIFHKESWEAERSQVQEYYAQSRYKKRLKMYFDRLDKTTSKITPVKDREAKAQKDERLRSLLTKEPYAVELGVAAKITSYYQIASRRFHDSICMRIESKFFEMLKAELLHELATGLDIAGPDGHKNCVRLLADNPVRDARRAELTRERDSLREGQRVLDDLVRKYGDSSMTRPVFGTPTKSTGPPRHQAYVSSPLGEDDEMVDAPDSGRSRR